MDVSLVYITAKDAAEAERVGRAVVEQRLAACVNIIKGMRSLYWWQGRLEEASEVVVIAKTRTDLVPALTAAVKVVHSYEVPCVVAVPIAGGNEDFLRWIREETRG